MGRFAIGMRAFGFSSGLVVNVGNDDPGPHRMMAWRPGAGIESAWGMAETKGQTALPFAPSVMMSRCQGQLRSN